VSVVTGAELRGRTSERPPEAAPERLGAHRACCGSRRSIRAVLRWGLECDGRRSVASFGAPCNAPDRRFRAPRRRLVVAGRRAPITQFYGAPRPPRRRRDIAWRCLEQDLRPPARGPSYDIEAWLRLHLIIVPKW